MTGTKPTTSNGQRTPHDQHTAGPSKHKALVTIQTLREYTKKSRAAQSTPLSDKANLFLTILNLIETGVSNTVDAQTTFRNDPQYEQRHQDHMFLLREHHLNEVTTALDVVCRYVFENEEAKEQDHLKDHVSTLFDSFALNWDRAGNRKTDSEGAITPEMLESAIIGLHKSLNDTITPMDLTVTSGSITNSRHARVNQEGGNDAEDIGSLTNEPQPQGCVQFSRMLAGVWQRWRGKTPVRDVEQHLPTGSKLYQTKAKPPHNNRGGPTR